MGILQKRKRFVSAQAWLLALIILLLLSIILIWYWYDRQLEQLETKTINPAPISWNHNHQPLFFNNNIIV